MAIFNLDYYSGKNLYSDGDIENVILNIVKSGQDYTEYVGSENYYPIMYHLSPERENILNWYPFKETDRVLEIGSGCGAITGLLCQKAKWVTSVELSKRRAEINYERHKSYENLEIIVGNLNDVVLEKSYDYVVLTGVFEYAISFTQSEEPYVTFLNNFKKYLTEAGKVLISIENRLGIKYFSGALEDHTNEYYLGVENYPGNNTVRTFSKTELEAIFRQCNIPSWKFYYPYPDYKFPTEIFTDENVNSENYGRVYRNYQKGKVELFNEIEMVKTLKAEKTMDVFSNSFLVELCVSDVQFANVVYAKLNNTRKENLCIATTIVQDADGYKVKKSALNENAIAHIEQIYENQSAPLPQKFTYLQGDLQVNSVEYPYLSNANLDSYMVQLLKAGKTGEIKKKIDEIYHAFMTLAEKQKEIYNPKFVEYFGNVQYEEEFASVINCNIDIIFDNLYPYEEGYVVIDPEWVCDFWIPVKFIIWRMLNEWYAKYTLAEALMPSKALYLQYGITEELAEVFRVWAIHFATRYVSCDDLDKAAVAVPKINMNHMLKDRLEANTIESSLYIDYGEGFSEAGKSIVKVAIRDNKFSFKMALDNTKMIHMLRWDPVEYRFCRCNIEKCCLDQQEVGVLSVNSEEQDEGLFLNMDPQFVVHLEPGNYSLLEVHGTFEFLQYSFVDEKLKREKQHSTILSSVNEVIQKEKDVLQKNKEMIETLNSELLQENELIRGELQAIKNSRSWRVLGIWRKLRGVGRND